MAILFVKLCCFICLLSSTQAADNTKYEFDDGFGVIEKRQIMQLSEDLYRDCVLQMRQLIDIREEHEDFISYGVGMIMGRIREKYRIMVGTYQDIVASYYGKTANKPPGVRYYRPVHIIIALEMIHYLELEIDKLVDVIVDEAEEDLHSARQFMGHTERPPTSIVDDFMLNATSPSTSKARLRSKIDIQREESQKSMLRQRFLMRKLGLPVDMTTQKKRFLRHWPVEETWALDKYNQDYK